MEVSVSVSVVRALFASHHSDDDFDAQVCGEEEEDARAAASFDDDDVHVRAQKRRFSRLKLERFSIVKPVKQTPRT